MRAGISAIKQIPVHNTDCSIRVLGLRHSFLCPPKCFHTVIKRLGGLYNYAQYEVFVMLNQHTGTIVLIIPENLFLA